jgi:metal-sulfur cluster biosynthetic enzyme
MNERFGRNFLLRLVLVLLFCAIGYGMIQVPGMVMDFMMATRRTVDKPAAEKHNRNIPPAASQTPEPARATADVNRQSRPAQAEQRETVAIKGSAANPEIIQALRTIIDPELGINIVDLGLILSIECHTSGILTITMIPTSPLCPYLKQMVDEIENTVPRLTRYEKPHVDIDMRQRWSPARLSQQGRSHFFGSEP